jgi:pilus assembly protein Flp/PilA
MVPSKLKEMRRSRKTRWLGASQEGQGLVEYALILVLVVLVVFVVVVWIGPWVGNVFSNVIFNI